MHNRTTCLPYLVSQSANTYNNWMTLNVCTWMICTNQHGLTRLYGAEYNPQIKLLTVVIMWKCLTDYKRCFIMHRKSHVYFNCSRLIQINILLIQKYDTYLFKLYAASRIDPLNVWLSSWWLPSLSVLYSGTTHIQACICPGDLLSSFGTKPSISRCHSNYALAVSEFRGCILLRLQSKT